MSGPPATSVVSAAPGSATGVAYRALSDGADARLRFVAAALCGVFGIAAAVLLRSGAWWAFILCAGISLVSGGFRATVSGVSALLARKPDINFLMVLVALVSVVLGHWDEAAILLFLFSLSDALERYAVERTRRGVTALMDLRPATASVVREEREFTIPVQELRVDDRVRVRPGERFPADGEVLDGVSAADESIVTGESLPVEKRAGSPILAGTINANGSLLVRVTRAAADSTIARIVALVETAQANKLRAQRAIERWQGPYVIAALGLSAVTIVAKLLTGVLEGLGSAAVVPAIQTGMILLVAMSPCAVVLATPVVVLAAVTRGARFGVLFKGGSHLESLAAVDTLACDKTGTLTRGRPMVTAVEPLSGHTPEAVLALAAGLESHSEHPLAQAVMRAARGRGLTPAEVTEFANAPGAGVWGTTPAGWVGVGTPELFQSHHVALPPGLAASAAADDGATRIVLFSQGGVGGVLTLSDELRPEAAAVLQLLRRLGLRRFALLTGDNAAAARRVAQALGITDVQAGLRPADKLAAIGKMARENGGVAMLGDGVNDAPALAAATVGIAMGAGGTDVALETADVVLLRDDLHGLAEAYNLARRSRAMIQMNLAFSGGVIAVLVCLTLLNLLWLPVAVLCHEGSTVVVVLNGLRLLREPAVGRSVA